MLISQEKEQQDFMCLLMEIYIIQEVFLPTNSNWTLIKSLALTMNLQDVQGSDKDKNQGDTD